MGDGNTVLIDFVQPAMMDRIVASDGSFVPMKYLDGTSFALDSGDSVAQQRSAVALLTVVDGPIDSMGFSCKACLEAQSVFDSEMADMEAALRVLLDEALSCLEGVEVYSMLDLWYFLWQTTNYTVLPSE